MLKVTSTTDISWPDWQKPVTGQSKPAGVAVEFTAGEELRAAP